MTAERVKRVLDVNLQERSLKVETQGGRIVEVPVEKDTGERRKKIPPEGTIESLFPVLQRAFIDYPQILSSDSDFWTKVAEQAKYTEEGAVNLLRRHGYSVKETSEEVVDRMLMLSGVRGVEEEDRETLIGYVEKEIHHLYIATTEVRVARKVNETS